MSNSRDKIKASRRRLKDENAVKRQTKIAKSHGAFIGNKRKEPHRFVKQHALNCGNPKCFMCGNPRKFFKELTMQEKRLFQDLDKSLKGINNEQD
jgi:hypothetical protein